MLEKSGLINIYFERFGDFHEQKLEKNAKLLLSLPIRLQNTFLLFFRFSLFTSVVNRDPKPFPGSGIICYGSGSG